MDRTLPRHARLLAAILLLAPAQGAHATLTAHLKVTGYNSGCLVDDHEPFLTGDPERYFRLGIFDDSSAGVLDPCANGCAGDGNPATLDGRTLDYCVISTGCSSVDPPDQTLDKV